MSKSGSKLAANEDPMSLSTRELNQLKKIVEIASKIIAKAEAAEDAKANSSSKAIGTKRKASKVTSKIVLTKTSKKASKVLVAPVKKDKRTRRSGAELIAFREMLAAERSSGIPVVELAKKHGVSPAYIYQL